MEYWAKTTPEGFPGISVCDHMLNVGHVARLIALQNRPLLDLLNLNVEGVASLAASHDVGKISQGFQKKCQTWLELNGLQEQARRESWHYLESDHSKISQFSLQNFLKQKGMLASSAGLWAAAVGGHHGRLHKAGERGLIPTPGMQDDQWETERQKSLQILTETFGDLPNLDVDQDNPALWWLAGLISVADWIGSDEDFFPNACKIDVMDDAAQIALNQIGLSPPRILNNLNFYDLFGHAVPNSLQLAALEFITAPGLYVIEAPMGMGKTEAALWCAYRLLVQGQASGIYFALPTQATSNRIHLRVLEYIKRMTGDGIHTRLIHGNSWLMENLSIPNSRFITDEASERSEAIARDWFASRKRALLAPFGVGTIDQALLGIIAARHFFVRRFALAGKVVIIDEVHSYDIYTGTLVDVLCHNLEQLGCTVILLSATLTTNRCAKLFGTTFQEENEEYPFLTGRKRGTENIVTRPVDLETTYANTSVLVQFRNKEEAAQKAMDVAHDNGCVLWICDTVSSAQTTFEYLSQLSQGTFIDIGLLHSRFPFYRREELENDWMTRLGKGEKRQGACILVSTQVVEQSVDLDTDLMISELAPTDMLLQRMGRLWRHWRQTRPIPSPIFIILAEQCDLATLRSASAGKIRDVLGTKALIYAPYVLLRSWEVWQGRDVILLPKDIRPMLTETYADNPEEAEEWTKLADDWCGNDYARKQRADWETNIFKILLDDEEGVNTRLNEQATISLVLALQVKGGGAMLMDGSRVTKDEGHFDLKTAQFLNRNVVRVPRSALVRHGKIPKHALPGKYVSGVSCWGILAEDGNITVPGLEVMEKILQYTDEIGVLIRERGEL